MRQRMKYMLPIVGNTRKQLVHYNYSLLLSVFLILKLFILSTYGWISTIQLPQKSSPSFIPTILRNRRKASSKSCLSLVTTRTTKTRTFWRTIDSTSTGWRRRRILIGNSKYTRHYLTIMSPAHSTSSLSNAFLDDDDDLLPMYDDDLINSMMIANGITNDNNTTVSYRNLLQTIVDIQQKQEEEIEYNSPNDNQITNNNSTNSNVTITFSNEVLASSSRTKKRKSHVQLIPDDDAAINYSRNNLIPINSLIFEIDATEDNKIVVGESSSSARRRYALVILRSNDTVDVIKLIQCYDDNKFLEPSMTATDEPCDSNNSNSDDRSRIRLARSDQVKELCGFEPGCVPPIGLYPKPDITFIDESLLVMDMKSDNTVEEEQYLIGGGGVRHHSLVLTSHALLDYYFSPGNNNDNYNCNAIHNNSAKISKNAMIANIRLDDDRMNKKKTTRKVRQQQQENNSHDGINGWMNSNEVWMNGDKNFAEVPTTSTKATDETAAVLQQRRIQELYDLQQQAPKPFFVVQPPPDDVAQMTVYRQNDINRNNDNNDRAIQPPTEMLLKSEYVSVVGRIAKVRRMASKLVFFDLYPPQGTINQDGLSDDDEHPWRCPRTGNDMAVQVIGGKSICEVLGCDDAGIDALKQLSPGQLIWIQGKTNVESMNSLNNWITKRSLDIALYSYQILQEDTVVLFDENAEVRKTQLFPTNPKRLYDNNNNITSLQSAAEFNIDSSFVVNGTPYLNGMMKQPKQQGKPKSTKEARNEIKNSEPLEYLRTDEIYAAFDVIVADTLEAVHAFSEDIGSLNSLDLILLGIDCEWKPNFLLNLKERDSRQPVLVLQICIHPLQKVYIFDLQTLLRPFLHPGHQMNEVEKLVSDRAFDVFNSDNFIKVGYQIGQDMKRLASSYPHVLGFHTIRTVLDVSALARKIFRVSKQHQLPASKVAMASLSKLTHNIIGKFLNKEQQCSDWSQRPMSQAQVDYAALDAVVSCALVDNLLDRIDGRLFNNPTRIGRSVDDFTFRESLLSWRFTVILPEMDSADATDHDDGADMAGRNDYFVVAQTWVTGTTIPDAPVEIRGATDPSSYAAANGNARIFSTKLSLASSTFDDMLDSMLGEVYR